MYRSDGNLDRTLLVTAFRGKVFAVDRATGEQRWRYEMGFGTIELGFAILDGQTVVIAASSTHLGIVRYDTGAELRLVDRDKHERGIGSRSVLLVDGSQLFLSGSGSVACYTLTGEFVWEQYFRGEGEGVVAIGLPGNVRQADDKGSR